MNARPAMGDGMAKPDGERGGKECGGYRLERVMEAMAGCRRRWDSTNGEDQRMT